MSDPIVWIDLETGGTDEKKHQITQIGAVATTGFPELEELASFEAKIELTDGRFEMEALELQGYSDLVWAHEAEGGGKVLREFDQWLRPHCHDRISKRTGNPYQVAHMAGHNADFDGRFLREAAGFYDIWLPLTNWTGGIFDTLQLAKWKLALDGEMVPDSLRLEDLCRRFGIELKAHDALNDVLATVQLTRCLIEEPGL